MIARIKTAIRRWRIRNLEKDMAVFAQAAMVAMDRGDHDAARGFAREHRLARQKRDGLLGRIYYCQRCRTGYVRQQECDWCPERAV